MNLDPNGTNAGTGRVAPEPAVHDQPALERSVSAVRRIVAAGRHAEGLERVMPLLADYPENRDLLLLRAICERQLGRIDAAFATLDRLAVARPEFSLLHQERGFCHLVRKDAPATIEALLRAVNINPALPMSWRMLEGVYRLAGDADNAARAAKHVAALAAQPPEIVTATSIFSDGDLAPAERIVRDFLLANGDHPEAMRLLAKIGMAQDVFDDAELLLAGALTIAPDHLPARYDYARCLVHRHKFEEAQVELDRLCAIEPRNFDYRSLAGTVAVGLGAHEDAIAIYRELLVERPDAAEVHLWLGHALKTIGRPAEAVASYRAAIILRPTFGDAYWSMANLKRYRFEEAEVAAMRAVAASADVTDIERAQLCFALGKAYEDRGEPSVSWSYYERGNALERARSRYRPEIVETNTRQQIETCTRAFFDARRDWGVADPDPIFILGLPRSGSTLLEQILASHSEVDGTQELPDVQRIVHELLGRERTAHDPRYPGILPSLTRSDFEDLGRRYLAGTRSLRTGRPYFIDKMPNNFRHIGLIRLMLPRAKIIDARRDPMSCCFSNLKQLFAQGQEFAYSIEDIARYYRTYLDLMAHWDAVLPGAVLRVQHEDVIEDLVGSVRRILTFCRLPFEESCLEFHRNRRSVRTPSSEQVRQPIFRDGLDQWRAFAPWLVPLQDALGDALDRYRV